MLLVTHNIEEAVLMCDRILVFAANPGRVEHDVAIGLPHPRRRDDPEFRGMVDEIYSLMTRRTPVVSEADLPEELSASQQAAPPLHVPIAPVAIGSMVGLIEALADESAGDGAASGRADLPFLASRAQMELDDLFPLVEGLQLLGLAELEDGDIFLTDEARRFAESTFDERKTILRHALLNRIPLIRSICSTLDERHRHSIDAGRFREELTESMSPAYAQQTLQTLIAWARYAELFDFNEDSDQLFLNGGEV
jgi:NitT/TauT family transport system ATP-binding protein